MRRQPSSWSVLLTKLGFVRKNSGIMERGCFGRRLRFEQCEDRRMLAPIVVNSWLDKSEKVSGTVCHSTTPPLLTRLTGRHCWAR
jgi:hypothetical protein